MFEFELPEVSFRVSLFCHLGASFFNFYRKIFLVQKCLCSPLTALLPCNFIMDDVIFKAFIFSSPVAWFDGINKICYIEMCSNVLKSHFSGHSSTLSAAFNVAATASSHSDKGLVHVELG